MNARSTISFALCALAACRSTSAGAPEHDSATHAPARHEPKLFHGGDGTAATWNELVAAAAGADVMFVGENHGHPLGLELAAKLFDDVLAREPHASLSLEFFERDDQSRIDDYLTGVSDLATFEKRTARTDRNFPPGHRAMVETAKRAHRPVHAANAPWAYVTLARKQGFDRLRAMTPEQRRLLRIPDELFDGRYRADFDHVMTAADSDPNDPEIHQQLDRAFRAQSVWDWTMSQSIANGLANGEHPVVQVIGHFHVDFRGGTVQALERQRPGTPALVLTFVAAWSDELAPDDRERGDFVYYVGPDPTPASQ